MSNYLDQAYHLFVEEALELLHQIQDGLLELHDNPSLVQIHGLMKTVAEIENGAAQVNLTDIKQLAHRLENAFRILWQEQIPIDGTLIDWLGQAYDCLRQALLAQIQTNLEETAEILGRADRIFTEIEAKLKPDSQIKGAIADDLGEQITPSFLDHEVVQALENLEKILSIADIEARLEALKAQTEAFLKLGEVLNISEFVAIAQITLATLQSTPQVAQTIGNLALAGFRSAYHPKTDAIDQLTLEAASFSDHEDILPMSSLDEILQGFAPVSEWIDEEARSHSFIEPNEHLLPVPEVAQTIHLTPSFPITAELTVNTDNFLVWLAGTNAFIIASQYVEEILLIEAHQLLDAKRQGILSWRDKKIPLYSLSQLLTYARPLKLGVRKSTGIISGDDHFLSATASMVAMINQGKEICALALDIEGLVTESPLTLKPFGTAIAPPPYCYGCTLLERDRLTLAIDILTLLDRVIGSHNSQPSTILVIDDSNTLRQIVVLTLEKAGYRVLQARDGWEGIQQLRQNPHIQLVISDIEMPNLNGFGFLQCCHQDPHLAKIPIVLLSTYYSEQHRHMAMQLGATAYLTKPYQEPEFLTTIESAIAAQKNT